MANKSPYCTLTDIELIEKVEQLIKELIDTGGKSWTMQIPARPNADHDLIFSELNQRFKAKTQKGAVWVKAKDRLPGLNKPVKWRSGGVEMKVQQLWYMVHDTNSEYLSTCEWYDESAAAATEMPTFWDVASAFKWAAEYGNELGEQLVLTEDGQWLLFKSEEGVTETDELTSGNVAELYCLQNGFTKEIDESAAGREDAAFAMLNYIQDELFRGSDRINGILVEDIYRAFKQQKEK